MDEHEGVYVPVLLVRVSRSRDRRGSVESTRREPVIRVSRRPTSSAGGCDLEVTAAGPAVIRAARIALIVSGPRAWAGSGSVEPGSAWVRWLVADGRHDDARPAAAPPQILEVAMGRSGPRCPEQEDLGRDLGQDRPQVEPGQQVDAMGQRPDRRQAVLLEVESPAVVEDRRELEPGCCTSGPSRRSGSRATVPGNAGPAAGPAARPAVNSAVGERPLHGRPGEPPRLAVQGLQRRPSSRTRGRPGRPGRCSGGRSGRRGRRRGGRG